MEEAKFRPRSDSRTSPSHHHIATNRLKGTDKSIQRISRSYLGKENGVLFPTTEGWGDG